MAKFIGEYRVKTDDKGRLVFPAPFKLLWPADEPVRLVVKRDLYGSCLELYPYAEWEKESEALKARLNFFNREHSLFWRTYMRNRALVEPDGKAGRISIPKRMLDEAGIVREAVFVGSDHKIELWSAEAYAAETMSPEAFAALAEKLLG